MYFDVIALFVGFNFYQLLIFLQYFDAVGWKTEKACAMLMPVLNEVRKLHRSERFT